VLSLLIDPKSFWSEGVKELKGVKTNVLLDYINKKHYVDIEVIRFFIHITFVLTPFNSLTPSLLIVHQSLILNKQL